MRGASPSAANVAGAREPCFGGRHRAARSRVRCLRGGTRRPRPHGRRCARTICNLALSGASEHAPEASRVSIAHLRREPCWRCDRGSSGAGRGLAQTRSRPWRLRAILTDPNGLWWWPKVSGAARPPGRGLEPKARNLRVRNYFLLTAPFATPRGRLPRPRRARRVLARTSRVLGGAVRPARLSRRAFLVQSGRSPNWPATPRECSLGSSAPTRRRCVILGCPAPCPSRGTSPQPTRRAPRWAVHGRIPGLECRSPPASPPPIEKSGSWGSRPKVPLLLTHEL